MDESKKIKFELFDKTIFGFLLNVPKETILNEKYLKKCEKEMVYNNRKNNSNNNKYGKKLFTLEKNLFSPISKKNKCFK